MKNPENRNNGNEVLKVPIILQCIEDHKIQNFLKALGAVHMKVEPIGKSDFKIVGT